MLTKKLALADELGDNSDAELEEVESEDDETLERLRQNEALILRVANHVKMAQEQRLLYQQKRQAALDTVDNKPSERILTFVGDYTQNLYIPNFASEQPGETYYFSPLSCSCFCMVDCSTTRLAAMLYTEDVGKKGGNNVASLIWTNLILKSDLVLSALLSPSKRLTL
jgi:hypothetical protein